MTTGSLNKQPVMVVNAPDSFKDYLDENIKTNAFKYDFISTDEFKEFKSDKTEYHKRLHKGLLICYFYAGDNDFLADNSNYASINRLIVELYTDYKDFNLEKTVEETLNAAGLVFSREESYISTEQMFQIVYESEVIING
jgi:hypothetical protein